MLTTTCLNYFCQKVTGGVFKNSSWVSSEIFTIRYKLTDYPTIKMGRSRLQILCRWILPILFRYFISIYKKLKIRTFGTIAVTSLVVPISSHLEIQNSWSKLNYFVWENIWSLKLKYFDQIQMLTHQSNINCWNSSSRNN